MLSLRKRRLDTLLKYFITNVHCTVIQYLIILSHTLKKGLYLLYSLLLLLLCIQEYFRQFIEKFSVFLNSLTHNEKSVHFYQVLEDLQPCFHHCLWFWSSRSKNNDSFSYTLTTKLFLLDCCGLLLHPVTRDMCYRRSKIYNLAHNLLYVLVVADFLDLFETPW
jgi:hypothetical protein